MLLQCVWNTRRGKGFKKLVNSRKRVAEPVEVACVERETQAVGADALEQRLEKCRIVGRIAVVLDGELDPG